MRCKPVDLFVILVTTFLSAITSLTPSTPDKKNLQELLSAFYNLVTSQHIDYHSPKVTTTQEGVETVIPLPSQDLHPSINASADLVNPSTTMTPSISDTTTLASNLSDYTPLLPDYDSYLSSFMLQQLRLKWLSFSSTNQPYHIPPRCVFME